MLNVLPDRVNRFFFGRPTPSVPNQQSQLMNQYNIKDNFNWEDLLKKAGLKESDLRTGDWIEKYADKKMRRVDRLANIFLDDLTEDLEPPIKTGIPFAQGVWSRFISQNRWEVVETEDLPEFGILDIENVMHRNRKVPVCATYMGANKKGKINYYVWIAKQNDPQLLIPFPRNRIGVQFYGYDRQFMSSEYSFNRRGQNYWLDVSAMNNVMYSLSNSQYEIYRTMTEERIRRTPWLRHFHGNSLADIYYWASGEELDKSVRADIIGHTFDTWWQDADEIMRYNMFDVYATAICFNRLYKQSRNWMPSNVAWWGTIIRGSKVMPLDPNFKKWVWRTNRLYEESEKAITTLIVELAEKELAVGKAEGSLLDWTPMKSGRGKGRPRWYHEIQEKLRKNQPVTLSQRTSIYLMNLKYKGHPVFWVKEGRSGSWSYEENGEIKKMPHSDFPDKPQNVASMFNKGYANLYRDKVIVSHHTDIDVDQIFQWADSLVNWRSMKKRAEDIDYQLATYSGGKWCLDNEVKGKLLGNKKISFHGIHIPQTVATGTQTCREANREWILAPQYKPSRIGTEFNGLIQAPADYQLVYADWSSQESMLAALYGDQLASSEQLDHYYPGMSPFSLSVFAGNKTDKTDIHSLVAQLIGLDRRSAKNCNFASQYFGGLVKKARMIWSASPNLTWQEALDTASTFNETYVGKKKGRHFFGGLASAYFNAITIKADSNRTTLPLTHRKRPYALDPALTGTEFFTTRANWFIQGAGVEILDYTNVGLDAWCEEFDLDAILSITVHDCSGHTCHDRHVEMLKKGYQVVHAATITTVFEAYGYITIPIGQVFFDEVDVNKRFTKAPGQAVQTPSNPFGFDDAKYCYLGDKKAFDIFNRIKEGLK